MFATLRRNKTWLWGILIIVVIVAFVIFFSPDVNLRPGEGGTATVAQMDGKGIPQDEFSTIAREASLRYFINNGQMPQEGHGGWDIETQAKQRLFLKDRAAKYGIRTSPEAAVVWLKNFPAFKDKNGEFSPKLYDSAVATLNRYGFSRYELESFAASEMAISQLIASFGAPGVMLSPRSVKNSLEESKQLIVTELAVFPFTNYNAEVSLNETNLTRFYTNRMSTYRIPEKIQIKYVTFPATNYLQEGIKHLEEKQKKTFDELIAQVYAESDPESFTDEDGKPLSADAAKAKIREQSEKTVSLQAARLAAGTFVKKYFEKDNPTEKDFTDAAAESGYTVQLSEPFSVREAPPGLDLTTTFSRSAFKLDATNAFLPPNVGTTNVYAICFAQKIQSTLPAYTNVAAKVREDYLLNETRNKARSVASKFRVALTNGLAKGDSFDALCTKSNIHCITLPDFTINEDSVDVELPIEWNQITRTVYSLPNGAVSTPIGQTNNICLLYVKERKPANAEDIQKELKDYTAQLNNNGLNSAFQEWFSIEYEKADVKTATDINKEKEAAEKEAAAKAAQQAAAQQAALTNAPANPSTPAVAKTNAPAAAKPATTTPAPAKPAAATTNAAPAK